MPNQPVNSEDGGESNNPPQTEPVPTCSCPVKKPSLLNTNNTGGISPKRGKIARVKSLPPICLCPCSWFDVGEDSEGDEQNGEDSGEGDMMTGMNAEDVGAEAHEDDILRATTIKPLMELKGFSTFFTWRDIWGKPNCFCPNGTLKGKGASPIPIDIESNEDNLGGNDVEAEESGGGGNASGSCGGASVVEDGACYCPCAYSSSSCSDSKASCLRL